MTKGKPKPYTIDPVRWPNRVALSDEHTQAIVDLIRDGKEVEAEEAFHELCLKIHDLKHFESFMLARALRRRAGQLPPLPKRTVCNACGWQGPVDPRCPMCHGPLPVGVELYGD
jgi:hypothetical protein